jgi:RHS repeat-associated protein
MALILRLQQMRRQYPLIYQGKRRFVGLVAAHHIWNWMMNEGGIMTVTLALEASASFTFATTGGLLSQTHVDGGAKMGLPDALGRPWFAVNACGFVSTQEYDAMHRVISTSIAQGSTVTSIVATRTLYGDSLPLATAQSCNLRGRIAERFTQAAWTAVQGFNLPGRPCAAMIALSCAYQDGTGGMPAVDIPSLDGTKPAAASLQSQTYTTALQRYDALDRTLEAVNANGNTTQLTYLLSGAPDTVSIDGVTYLRAFTYNAKRQLLSVVKGADQTGAGLFTTMFRYDAKSDRRKQCYASTSADFIAALPDSESAWIDGEDDAGRRQDIQYVFDPNGNVSHVQDAYPTIVFGEDSPAQTDYGYDALYRLLTANGNECATAAPVSPDTDGGAQLTPYQQYYSYDDGGNITALNHYSQNTFDSGRSVAMEISNGSNRAISASYYQSLGGEGSGGNIDESFFTAQGLFDAGGNQLKTPDLSSISWDYRNQIIQVTYPDPSDATSSVTEYRVHDASGGTRTRKITITSNAAGLVTQLDTVAYLGDVELRASYTQSDPNVSIGYDGETVSNAVTATDYSELRIKLGHAQSARILNGVLASGTSVTAQTYYSLSDHLDSCQMELDDDGDITNYQSFYPYGGTAFSAAGDNSESGSLALKQLQYSGQEKDGSGLYCYGFRYYDTSVFRWTRPDPAGFRGSGLNWYQMVNGNPVTYRDAWGLTRDPSRVGKVIHNQIGKPLQGKPMMVKLPTQKVPDYRLAKLPTMASRFSSPDMYGHNSRLRTTLHYGLEKAADPPRMYYEAWKNIGETLDAFGYQQGGDYFKVSRAIDFWDTYKKKPDHGIKELAQVTSTKGLSDEEFNFLEVLAALHSNGNKKFNFEMSFAPNEKLNLSPFLASSLDPKSLLYHSDPDAMNAITNASTYTEYMGMEHTVIVPNSNYADIELEVLKLNVIDPNEIVMEKPNSDKLRSGLSNRGQDLTDQAKTNLNSLRSWQQNRNPTPPP